MKTAKTTIDQYGTVGQLARFVDFIPGRRNDQPVALDIPMLWLRNQHCPEHPDARTLDGKGWTHVRAKWAKHPLVPFSERPAVMFLCPRGHAWQVVITNPGDGSF